jgi:hypothetical protein
VHENSESGWILYPEFKHIEPGWILYPEFTPQEVLENHTRKFRLDVRRSKPLNSRESLSVNNLPLGPLTAHAGVCLIFTDSHHDPEKP